MWRKVRHFSTDLDTNEKPDRISFIITCMSYVVFIVMYILFV